MESKRKKTDKQTKTILRTLDKAKEMCLGNGVKRLVQKETEVLGLAFATRTALTRMGALLAGAVV